MSLSGTQATRDLSPAAQAAASWFLQLARALRVFRLYRGDNPVVVSTQETTVASLAELLRAQGGWELRFSPTEVFLGDEPVVRVAAEAPGAGEGRGITDEIPFLFYRDGIRGLTLGAETPSNELAALMRILRVVCTGGESQDDLVTLLWQANLTDVQIDAVPLEQTIYVSASGDDPPDAPFQSGQAFAAEPTASDVRDDVRSTRGAQGLHRDTFDDWPLPGEGVEVPEAFARLEPSVRAGRDEFLQAWEREAAGDWLAEAPVFLRGLHALDDSLDMRRAITRSVTTWLVSALQRMAWDEATRALELLNETDPDRALGGEELTAALNAMDTRAIADRFEEGDSFDQTRFAAFIVAVGLEAVPVCVDVMARAEKSRARAATVTALCYLCAEHPEVLAPWLDDSRWYVVRNIVFVLGHIGDPAVAPLLHGVARHPDLRVRRELVQALGAMPAKERNPLLIEQLATRDPQLLSAALNMLARDRDPRIARAILACIEAPDFESRDEDNQRALFNALGEVAADDAVPALEALLHKGGWFARRTLQRIAAARTLRRIGTPGALSALEAATHARSEAVRSTALEALGARSRP